MSSSDFIKLKLQFVKLVKLHTEKIGFTANNIHLQTLDNRVSVCFPARLIYMQVEMS